MAPKAKSGPGSLLSGKAYKESVTELFSSTALRQGDIDPKAIHLLDALQKAGKAQEACEHLKKNLEGVAREKVQNWRAYSYKMLREFDIDVYNNMKAKAEGNRSRGGAGKKGGSNALNPDPVEFQPGVWWQGDHNKGMLTPKAPTMAYPYPNMMAMMMPQMMMAAQQAGGAPPPPPAKAAQVPKEATDSKEAPAPEKPADATISTEAKDAPAADAAPASDAR